ncbi:MAG: HD domain-containing protein [Desulfobacterales bacterium]|nr:HD domain-containing protein [Desulfobacterales bacterium]
MVKKTVSLDKLFDVLNTGGTIKAGFDILSENGELIVKKGDVIKDVAQLQSIKDRGVKEVPVHFRQKKNNIGKNAPVRKIPEVELRLREIIELKKEAFVKYKNAKNNIKKVISDIKNTGGRFEYDEVENTVSDLLTFLTANENAFSYLTKEIFSYDDYLYNHSVNVCTVGTAVLRHFNSRQGLQSKEKNISFTRYTDQELHDISIGYFLHDVGKVLIPDEILNKKDHLTDEEFEIVKRHSYEKGLEILEKNGLDNTFITNVVMYHHCALYKEEERCYPNHRQPEKIPIYVKISKLVDIYDAMTAKRCYKEAIDPTKVVTTIFRKFAEKEPQLQFVLHAFMKVIGIYPPGSIASMINGQLAFILDSRGPIIILFTDNEGNTQHKKQEPVNLSEEGIVKSGLMIDRSKPTLSPARSYSLLPDYLKRALIHG